MRAFYFGFSISDFGLMGANPKSEIENPKSAMAQSRKIFPA
jgi:hypothetical protein